MGISLQQFHSNSSSLPVQQQQFAQQQQAWIIILADCKLKVTARTMTKSPAKIQWGKAHLEALQALFRSKAVDPKNREAGYVDNVREEEGNLFLQVPKDRFRYHYKKRATEWEMENALAGKRRSESPHSALINHPLCPFLLH
jgi:hypothetical protein